MTAGHGESLPDLYEVLRVDLNLAGIRRVLQLQEETRRLQAEVATLRELAAGSVRPGRGADPPPGTRLR